MEKNMKKNIYIRIYVYLNYFVVHQRLTQCCKGKDTFLSHRKSCLVALHAALGSQHLIQTPPEWAFMELGRRVMRLRCCVSGYPGPVPWAEPILMHLRRKPIYSQAWFWCLCVPKQEIPPKLRTIILGFFCFLELNGRESTRQQEVKRGLFTTWK